MLLKIILHWLVSFIQHFPPIWVYVQDKLPGYEACAFLILMYTAKMPSWRTSGVYILNSSVSVLSLPTKQCPSTRYGICSDFVIYLKAVNISPFMDSCLFCLLSILGCLGLCNQVLQTRWFLSNRNLFFYFCKLRSPRSKCQQIWYLMKFLSLFQRKPWSHCAPVVEGERLLLGLLM